MMGPIAGASPGWMERLPEKSTIVVTPPKAAARLAASGGWVTTSARPAQFRGTGMPMWVWGFDAPREDMLAGGVNGPSRFNVQCARLGNDGDPPVLYPYIQLRRTHRARLPYRRE